MAFSDESNWSNGRFRSLAVVSICANIEHSINVELHSKLHQFGLKEYKWKRTKTSKYRQAAIGFVDLAIAYAVKGVLRVDVLAWDIEDSRHKVRGRDDEANFQRMYYHVFNNILTRRWPKESSWILRPDEFWHSWDPLRSFLDISSTKIEVEASLYGIQRPKKAFDIVDIKPCKSHLEPLIQLCDLFAGLTVFSREKYDEYNHWSRTFSQLGLFEHLGKPEAHLSSSDRERCPVLHHAYSQLKRHNTKVSLNSSRCLKTLDPTQPFNFWWWDPQGDYDKAPTTY